MWAIVIDTSGGLSAHGVGGGTVGSGDCAFCGGKARTNSAALGLGTRLGECSN